MLILVWSKGVTNLMFFYGTLMTGFDRRRRVGIEGRLTYVGRGWIAAALFDLGIYPAAVPATDDRVWGEVYEMKAPALILPALDAMEGYSPDDHEHSLYRRAQTRVTLEDGRVEPVLVYFYNAPLGGAQRIPSGDYVAHVKAR